MRRRETLIAAGAGVAAAVAVVLIGSAVAGNEPQTDGSFVLSEPGIYDEPTGIDNADASGDRLPDVTLEDADGMPVDLAIYRGGPTVINLWFSTCVPCARELVDFAAVHAEYGDRVAFVGVNPFDTPEAMLRFADERAVSYDLLRDPERELSIDLGIVGYPVTLFVSADGQIVEQTGEIDAAELRATIEELLL